MIEEIQCEKAIDYEYPPDGGQVPVVDAYDGCQLNCPYCFQWEDPAWNQDILVKTNLPDVLARELAGRDAAETLYVGSRGDPYMPLEGQYHLTRQTLEVLRAHAIPCMLSTKSVTPAFYEDIGLFRAYGERLTMCIGLANLAQLCQTSDPGQLPNVQAVHELVRQGVTTRVFITPVLPGITDVPALIRALPDSVPIFLDKLRFFSPGSAPDDRFFTYWRAHFPELEARDEADPHYEQLRELCQADARIKFVFGEA